MNIIERQAELSRSLFEINSNTLKDYASLQRNNIETWFETNKAFGEKLPEVKGVSDFVELQREYGEVLWSNMRQAVESQGELMRTAFEETSEALRVAFAPESKESKEKGKAKAKKSATAEN